MLHARAVLGYEFLRYVYWKGISSNADQLAFVRTNAAVDKAATAPRLRRTGSMQTFQLNDFQVLQLNAVRHEVENLELHAHWLFGRLPSTHAVGGIERSASQKPSIRRS